MKIHMIASHKISLLITTVVVITNIPVLAIFNKSMSSSIAEASEEFSRPIEVDFSLVNRQNLRVVNIDRGNRSKALNYLESGSKKFDRHDYQGALADYNRAIQIDSNFVEAYNYRGNLKQNRLGDFTGALTDFNRAIQLSPNYALLYKNRGVLKIERFQDYQGALTDLNRAIQLEPNYAEAYGQRGGIKHEILKDRAGGIADTQKAAKLFKEQGDLINYKIAIGLLKKWQQADRKSR